MDKIGEIYEEQIRLSKDKIIARQKELIACAKCLEKWAQKEYRDDSIELTLSLERLDLLVHSYFYDIIRYRSFHGMLDHDKESNVNLQKVYAFTAKWVLKEKPLICCRDDLRYAMKEDDADAERYIKFAGNINEIWLLAWIESSYVKHHAKHQRAHLQLTDGLQKDNLIYKLKYREFSVSIFEELLNAKMGLYENQHELQQNSG